MFALVQTRPAAAFTDGQNAFGVMGQLSDNPFLSHVPNFTSSNNDGSAKNLANGFGTGDMVIDTVNHRLFVMRQETGGRTLMFNLDSNNDLLDHVPDAVLGQDDFNSSVAETAGASTAGGVNTPRGIAYDSDRGYLFIGDGGLDRVLVYDVNTVSNGEDAIHVLLQSDFTSYTTGVTASTGAYDTGALDYDGDNQRLFVSDRSNSRVLVFDMATITDGEAAVNVIGQPDFVTNTAGTTASVITNPQGVIYDRENERLFVSDAAPRALVFDLSDGITDGEAAVHVLGQLDFTSTVSAVTASNAAFNAMEIDYDNDYLFVASFGQQRVLVFDISTITDGEDAIHVLGKPDFVTSGSTTGPTGMGSAGFLVYNSTSGKLNVLDATGRMAIYDLSDGITDGESVVDVMGQYSGYSSGDFVPDTSMNGPGRQAWGLDDPEKIQVDTTGHRMFVSDGDNARVLIFNLNTDNTLTDMVADNVIGQTEPSVITTGASASSTTLSTANNGLRISYDSSGNRLFISDPGNHRVLVFDVATVTDGEAAINVLGQADFTASSSGVTSTTMNSPRDVLYDDTNDRLYVAEYQNHRVTIYNIGDGITDGEAAVNVLGQTTFTTNSATNNALGTRNPLGLALDSVNNRLFVSGFGNDRISVFDVATITDGETAIAALGTSATNVAAHDTTAQNLVNNPSGLYYDATNERLFVSSWDQGYVQIYDTSDGVTTSENAINVIGQSTFTGTGSNTTQSGLISANVYSPFFDEVNNILYVPNGDRITMYLDSAATISISGTAYSDSGVTAVVDGTTINLLQNGTSIATTTTTAGAFTLTPDEAEIADNAVLTLFIDGGTEQGVAITRYGGSAITGIDIYANTLRIQSENSSPIETTDLNTANNADSDITAIYSDGSAPVIASGVTMNILSGEEFTLTGTLGFLGSLDLDGTMSGSGYLNFQSNFTNSGSIDSDISIEMGGTGAQTIDVGAGSLASNLIISNTGGTVTVTGNSLDLTGNLTLVSGSTLALSGFGLSVTGTFSNSGTVELNGGETITLTQDTTSGVFEYVGDNDATADAYTVDDVGSTDYYNVIFNAADGLDTFNMPSAVTIAGDFTNTSGFAHNSGAVTFSASADHTITGATTWGTLNFSETTNDNTDSAITLANNQIVETALSMDGLDTSDRLQIRSSVVSTARTITFSGAATFSGDYLDIQDSTAVDSSSNVDSPVNPEASINSGNTTNWMNLISVYESDGSTELIENDASPDTDTLLLTLTEAPASDVVLNISSNDTTSVTVSPAVITFTTANWEDEQVVTLTSLGDSDTSNEEITITVSVDDVLSDNTFDAESDQTVVFTVDDNDSGGGGGGGGYTIKKLIPVPSVAVPTVTPVSNAHIVAPQPKLCRLLPKSEILVRDTGSKVRNFQRLLRSEGVYSGSINGRVDVATRNSMIKLRKKIGSTHVSLWRKLLDSEELILLRNYYCRGDDSFVQSNPLPDTTSCVNPPAYHVGTKSTTSEIKALQKFLANRGLLAASRIDGNYGSGTKLAVAGLQLDGKIPTVPKNRGIYGPATMSYVRSHMSCKVSE